MIKTFLSSLEDPNKPLFGPNYWILKKTGLISPESKVGRFIYILLHVTASYFVFTQCIELYIIRSDLDLVLTNLKITMLSVVCIMKLNTFLFWQSSWKEVINYITEADKHERKTTDPSRRRILDKYTKYCRQMTYNYWVLVFTTVLATTGTPLMQYMLSTPAYRDSLKNGTEPFPHIFSSWMPFDKNHAPGSWITVVWHFFVCTCGATVVAAYDTSVIVIMVYFGGKLDLLRERCKQMLGTNGITVSDEEFYEGVRELHKTHVLFLKYSRLFNSMLSPVMFFYMVMCSLMLCASAYQLTSVSNAGQKLLTAEYLIFGIAQLFIFCWHSNDVFVKVKYKFEPIYLYDRNPSIIEWTVFRDG